MLDFIKADIFRVLKKKSYITMTALVLVLFAATITVILTLTKAPEENIDLAGSLLGSAAVLFIGIPVFTGVFNDSINSKSLQIIIGSGVSRKKLVLSKYFEYLLILAQTFIVISLVSLILFVVTGHISDSGSLLGELWEDYLVAALSLNVAMMIVFGTQSPTGGLIVFISLIADVFNLVLTGISYTPFMAEHHIDLSLILPSNLLYEAMHNDKPTVYIIAAIGYFVIPLIVSVKVFEKKELEF